MLRRVELKRYDGVDPHSSNWVLDSIPRRVGHKTNSNRSVHGVDRSISLMIDGRRLDSQTSLTLTNYNPHGRVDNRSFLE